MKLFGNLYWNQKATVTQNGELSESINIKQWVRQQYVASPHLFVLYTDMIMGRIEGKGGLRIGGNVINNLSTTWVQENKIKGLQRCYMNVKHGH